MKNKYKGISFCESWKNGNKTFDQFKTEFENVWVFNVLEPKEKLSELKKAYKIATTKTDEIKVSDAKVIESKKATDK